MGQFVREVAVLTGWGMGVVVYQQSAVAVENRQGGERLWRCGEEVVGIPAGCF